MWMGKLSKKTAAQKNYMTGLWLPFSFLLGACTPQVNGILPQESFQPKLTDVVSVYLQGAVEDHFSPKSNASQGMQNPSISLPAMQGSRDAWAGCGH